MNFDETGTKDERHIVRVHGTGLHAIGVDEAGRAYVLVRDDVRGFLCRDGKARSWAWLETGIADPDHYK